MQLTAIAHLFIWDVSLVWDERFYILRFRYFDKDDVVSAQKATSSMCTSSCYWGEVYLV